MELLAPEALMDLGYSIDIFKVSKGRNNIYLFNYRITANLEPEVRCAVCATCTDSERGTKSVKSPICEI